MANNNRNQGDQYNDSNYDWDQNRRRYNRDYDYDQNRDYYGNMNYNRDFEERNMGNYGGYNRTDYNRNQDYPRHRESNIGYQDMRDVNYGEIYHGNVERREQETNRAMGGRFARMSNDYRHNNQDYRNTGGNYGRDEYQRNQLYYGQDWNNMSGNYGRNDIRRDYNDNWNRTGYYNDQDRRNNDYSNRQTGDRNWQDRTKNDVSSWMNDNDNNRQNAIHKGKGPRGYQRSNERIHEDICDRLSDDDYLDASDIDVKVDNNEVILSGTVHSREEKRRAEDLAESISGVRNVENRIKVEHDRDNRSGNDYDTPYTTPSDEGREAGTTNEIIRNTGNMRRNG